MFNFSQFVHLRYVLLINILVSMAPSMDVKGRANDPLQHAAWWTIDQHSAVFVVGAAAILGTALALALTRLTAPKRWAFVVCTILVGIFPATFYSIAAQPATNLPLPDMYATGTICGAIGGFVVASLLRKRKTPSAAA